MGIRLDINVKANERGIKYYGMTSADTGKACI